MKNFYFLIFAAILLLLSPQIFGQHYVLKQVLVGAGGAYSDPDDFVTVSSYNPVLGQSFSFGTVYTQSVQDVIVHGDYIYVAAQDSLAKFNAVTYQQVAVVEALGVNKLKVVGDKLMASFAYPVTENYLRAFNADDLSFVKTIEDISGEASYMLVVDNVLYLAVPGDWTSTSGKIAMVDMDELVLLKEVDLGVQAAGISNLFLYNDHIVSVNASAWGATTGYLTVISQSLSEKTHYLFQHALSKAAGLSDQSLYLVVDGGIGEINLSNMEMVNASIVVPPAMSIAAAIMDTLNNDFFVTTTDYATQGVGLVYNMNGELITTFEAGISAEAIALDYRISVGIDEQFPTVALSAWPNPTIDKSTITIPESFAGGHWSLTNVQGKSLLSGSLHQDQTEVKLELNVPVSGLYLFTIMGEMNYGLVKIMVR